jgi:hypothetical protein
MENEIRTMRMDKFVEMVKLNPKLWGIDLSFYELFVTDTHFYCTNDGRWYPYQSASRTNCNGWFPLNLLRFEALAASSWLNIRKEDESAQEVC